VKAVVLKENGRLEFEEISLPPIAADQCQIRVSAAGICSSDIIRSFDNGAYFYPLVMGHELAGEIIEVGSSVTGFRVGDRVGIFPLLPCGNCEHCLQKNYVRCANYDYYGSRRHGGFAEFLNVNSWNLLPVPPEVATENVAALEAVSVVNHALNRGNYKSSSNRRLGIIGGGFLGLIAAQVIRLERPDIEIKIFERNKFKLDLARQMGFAAQAADDTFAWDAAIEGEFDLVLESCGASSTMSGSLKLVKAGGTVIWMGNPAGDVTFSKNDLGKILRKEITIVGTWNSSYWTEALALMQRGLNPSALISRRVKLSEIPDAIQTLSNHKKRIAACDYVKVMYVAPEL
jgi:L-iditol 2-dehydrogenase